MHSDTYSIDALVEITATPRTLIVTYCEQGLLEPLAAGNEPEFDDHAVHQLRRLEFLRAEYGANVSGLRALCDLLRRVEELQAELRFLRGR